jgi:hypothetical protein
VPTLQLVYVKQPQSVLHPAPRKVGLFRASEVFASTLVTEALESACCDKSHVKSMRFREGRERLASIIRLSEGKAQDVALMLAAELGATQIGRILFQVLTGERRYLSSKSAAVNFRVRQFSRTVRSTGSGTPSGVSASTSRRMLT